MAPVPTLLGVVPQSQVFHIKELTRRLVRVDCFHVLAGIGPLSLDESFFEVGRFVGLLLLDQQIISLVRLDRHGVLVVLLWFDFRLFLFFLLFNFFVW